MKQKEIDRLHAHRLAKRGVTYTNEKGITFIGLENGRVARTDSTGITSEEVTQSINTAVAAIPATPVTPTTSGVASVTDDSNGVVTVDNTDPVNPVIEFQGVNVDGITVTGDGTSGSPLVAVVPAGYTDEQAQDAVGNVMDTTYFTYDDATPSYTLKKAFTYTIGWAGTVASTNTAALEALANIRVPGGTVSAGDSIFVEYTWRKMTGAGSAAVQIRLNSATGTGGTIISNSNSVAALTHVYAAKILVTGAATQTSWPINTSNPYGQSAVDTVAHTFNTASDIWINLTSQKVTAGDTSELRGIIVTIQKYRT